MTTTIDGPSLIKRLASCNKSVRDKTLNLLLQKWLPFQTQIPDDDMKKLWKGLFYCVWHSDKAPVQAALADRLSSVLPSLHLPLATHYFSVFLLTMRREWTGIDALRLDKFYLLIRRFLHYLFVVLRKCWWDLEVVKRYIGLLVDNCLLADNKLVGNGVSYHVVSIFVDEIRPFLPLEREVVEELFGVLVVVMGRVQDKVLVGKIKSCVFDVLLKKGCRLLEAKKKEGEGEGEVEDDVVVLGTVGLVMGFSGKFFEMGSSVECWQGNRKVLFRLHEQFLKLEKDLASSGVEVSIPEVSFDDEEDDEVPTLVPIVNEMEVDGGGGGDAGEGSDKKVLKKCKKSEKGKEEKGKKPKKEERGKKPKKKKKKNVESSVIGMEENVVSANGEFSIEGEYPPSNSVCFNESVISNLQMQFEKVAAEVGMDGGVGSSCDLQNGAVNGTIHKKRKRAKGSDGQQHSQALEANNQPDGEEGCATGKSAKKVRFSMKNNLVWKPQSPLPPQSLRLPPSVTPRGSALKKGVAPGPIREMPVVMKKAKQRAKSLKKARKVIKIKNPALKSVKKLKSLST